MSGKAEVRVPRADGTVDIYTVRRGEHSTADVQAHADRCAVYAALVADESTWAEDVTLPDGRPAKAIKPWVVATLAADALATPTPTWQLLSDVWPDPGYVWLHAPRWRLIDHKGPVTNAHVHGHMVQVGIFFTSKGGQAGFLDDAWWLPLPLPAPPAPAGGV